MSNRIIHKASINSLCQLDPIFEQILIQYGPPPNYQRPEGFETLLRIILEQQVSLESAYATYQQLKNRLGHVSPEKVLTLDDQEMRACYISRQKTRYLRILSQAILDKTLDLDKLRKLPETEIKAQLTAITGIGNWTAEVYSMFALQLPDIFPIGDIAAVNAVKAIKNVEGKEAVLKCSEEWRPYRTAATFFLWHFYLRERNRSVDHLL